MSDRIRVARGRIEIHHSPYLFDDHFRKNWGAGSLTDGEILTFHASNQVAVSNSNFTAFSTSDYPHLITRVDSCANGTLYLRAYYDADWHDVASVTSAGLYDTTLPVAKIISNLEIRLIKTSETYADATVDYVSVVKSISVPLDPPLVQDLIGRMTVINRMNKSSTADFVVNNTVEAGQSTAPYINTTVTPLDSNATNGESVVHVVDYAGFEVGESVIISDSNNSETKVIYSFTVEGDGYYIHFTTPISHDYLTEDDAQITGKTNAISNKDKVIIWGYRDGDTVNHDSKLFGGIITNIAKTGQDVLQRYLRISCMDHGWELNKPFQMDANNYSVGLNPLSNPDLYGYPGKQILTDAVNCCSYLSGVGIDSSNEIATYHNVDYSQDGREVTPYRILEEIAPKCKTAGGAIGFDWRITPAGEVKLYPKSSESSGLSFDEVDFETFDREEDWWRCFNTIPIYGAVMFEGTEMVDPCKGSYSSSTANEGQQNITVADSSQFAVNDAVYIVDQANGLQEENMIDSIDAGNNILTMWGNLQNTYVASQVARYPGWLPWVDLSTGDITDDPSNVYDGTHSVKLSIATLDPNVEVVFRTAGPLDFTSLTEIDFYVKLTGDNCTGAYVCHATLYDSLLRRAIHSTGDLIKDIGYQHVHIDSYAVNTTGWTVDSGFDWSDVRMVGFVKGATGAPTTFWIDKMFFGRNRYKGTASNATSIVQWGILMREPETDSSLNSDNECLAKADGILTLLQQPIVTYSSLRLLKGQKVIAGQTLAIQETVSEIDDTLPIVEVTHDIAGTDWEISIKLSTIPVEMDYLFKIIHGKVDLSIRRGTEK